MMNVYNTLKKTNDWLYVLAALGISMIMATGTLLHPHLIPGFITASMLRLTR